MLTQSQIKDIARKSSINPFYEEKEYLQQVFLYNLYKENRDYVFKGGTCLKIAYRFPRFSEDLDFNANVGIKEIQRIIDRTLASFDLLGIKSEYVKKESFDRSYTSKIRFYGPLYSGRVDSTNSIQLDVGKRDETILAPKWVQVNPPYPDLPRYFIQAMDEVEILAEKIRALHMRSAPRDLFDVWSMLNAGINVDRRLVERKMHGKEKKAKICSKEEYERDLKNLLPVLPTYAQVTSELKKAEII